MKHLLHGVLVTAVAFLAVESASAAIIIDSFDDSQVVTQTGIGTAAGFVNGAMIGGQRDVEVIVTNGETDLEMTADAGGNSLLTHSQDSNVVGSTLVVWDGIDNDPLTVDPTGLGGVDLTGGGILDAIAIRITFDDLPVNLTMRVGNGANVSERMLALPGGIFSPILFVLPFASFATLSGTGADFMDVGVIELMIDGQIGGTDVEIDFLQAITEVPEPATLTLLASSLFGLFVIRRRKQKNQSA